MSEPVLYEVDGRVARLTLNRPERGNGLTRALITSLAARVEEAGLAAVAARRLDRDPPPRHGRPAR